MNVLINKLTNEYVESLSKLERASFGKSDIDAIQLSLDSSTNDYFVICVGDELIGYCHILYLTGECEIINIAIDDKWKKNGFGSLLLEYTINHLDDCGDMFLEVRTSNLGAVSLYKKFGFVEVGLRKKYYRDGEDAIIMKRDNEMA